jgi:putative photosynthetic complex assembly protein 2
MTLALASVGFVILLWWSATGAIFALDRLPRRTFGWSLGGATLVLIVSLAALGLTSGEATPTAAFMAFAAAIGVWGWNELLFLTGAVTGPNRSPAEAGLKGWRRFSAAARSVIHHEVVILASGIAVTALTIAGPNRVGLWSFMVLWAMRLSAKLNIYVGVPNPGERFLPEHLAYLAGHFRKAPVGRFFAATMTAATLALAAIALFGAGDDPSAFEVAGVSLVATLLALAVIEHVFLAVPWDSGALWRLRGRPKAASDNRRRRNLPKKRVAVRTAKA